MTVIRHIYVYNPRRHILTTMVLLEMWRKPPIYCSIIFDHILIALFFPSIQKYPGGILLRPWWLKPFWVTWVCFNCPICAIFYSLFLLLFYFIVLCVFICEPYRGVGVGCINIQKINLNNVKTFFSIKSS